MFTNIGLRILLPFSFSPSLQRMHRERLAEADIQLEALGRQCDDLKRVNGSLELRHTEQQRDVHKSQAKYMDMRAANVTLTNALKRHDDNMIKQQQNMFGVESETNMLRQQLDKVNRKRNGGEKKRHKSQVVLALMQYWHSFTWKRSRRKEETFILRAVCCVPCAVCCLLTQTSLSSSPSSSPSSLPTAHAGLRARAACAVQNAGEAKGYGGERRLQHMQGRAGGGPGGASRKSPRIRETGVCVWQS